MREIKFRAWDKDNKKIITPTSLHFICGHLDIVRIEEQSGISKEGVIFKKLIPINNFELLQFTGLKDINGEEIYEGDIVEDDTKINGVVRWNNYDSCYSIYKKDYPTLFSEYSSRFLEVIGNIYENPELMDKEL